MRKLWLFYRSTSELWFRRAEIDSHPKSGGAMSFCLSRQQLCKVVPRSRKAQQRVCNLSRACEAGIHTRRLARANRLMWGIGLDFGMVDVG
jgi:hypothetical protein